MNIDFDQLLNQGKLPQVLLFSGTSQESLLAYAKECAKKLLGQVHGSRIDSGNHPDLHLYIPDSSAGLHSMASIKALIEESALTPLEAPMKVFIIDEAERMLPSSSNALLKTLEEPEGDCYIWLCTTQPELILPTIRSRCRYISINSTEPAKSFEWQQSLESCFKAALGQDYHLLLQELEELEKTFQEITAHQFEELISSLLHGYHSLASSKKLSKVLNLLEECRLGFERNIKTRSLLMHFFLSI